MRSVSRVLAAVALSSVTAVSWAGLTQVYTSSAAFYAHLAPGSYTETFTGVVDGFSNTQAFGGVNGLSFTASLEPGHQFYFDAEALSTNLPNDAITLTFTGGPVTAVGANFFNIDIADALVADLMKITIVDSVGTLVTFNAADFGSSFRGFMSDAAITSITVSGGTDAGRYAAIDNLVIGRELPEPASLALFGAAFAALAAARRRTA